MHRSVRRLAAILAADVVGYARLIDADEEGTLRRLRSLFRDAVQPAIGRHGGRIFKLMGDGFLAEFPSAVEAVRCAAALQDIVAADGSTLGPEQRIALRIGVHLGDLVVEGGDRLGEGVNLATRLEGEAEPGAVLVSAAIAEAVRGRVSPFVLEDLGERALRNIERPMRVFRLGPAGSAAEALPPALPDRPSLVVLPFQNMSDDPGQDYFADGMVEDITTALSRIRWLFVIARNSAFAYKGRPTDVRQVGREFGVRYVIEGSVRRAGGRVRITAQLIHAATARHIWASHFDGDLDDVFALQDEVTEAIAAAIEPSLRSAEIDRAQRKPPESLDAYDLYLRALPLVRAGTREASDLAIAKLRRAVAADRALGLAKGLLAFAQATRCEAGWLQAGDREEGIRLARELLDEGNEDPTALAYAGRTLGFLGQDRQRCALVMERAMRLNPNSAFVQGVTGWTRNYLAQPRAAIPLFHRAMRLSPLDPEAAYFLSGLAYAQLMLGEPEEALAAATRAVREKPSRATQHRAVIAALVALGRMPEALDAAAAYRLALPEGARVMAARVDGLFEDKRFVDLIVGALRAVGLPE